ncbi:general secretion pathway protein GspM [Xylella taiwanensis]|uniref:General secretion pathway protein M n=1 Tax=Xylella taiwanensis TaxID=1444770 RepID=Z9JH66_9GAMM|nr:type II secretion system protein GspM [Xylella taiwanensis]AXI83848.1 general secretion pathway protein GspM [Xylella taiwanensis]EWS77067.1 general secretion pathway protein M [Xylella taiwanensis]MCD8456950.1 type II secretion system protein GspM [Xylella taiwanensis]MCD8459361.1 type II secretion system protein GspM [Xylella taiwanensis]MCD8461768.1 type II secretion system protein GspM [Xylella taiwanensis]
MAMHNVNPDRWWALGLLFLMLSVLYMLLVHPWFTRPMLIIQQQIQALRDRELKVRSQLQQGPKVDEQLRRIQMVLQSRPGFLPEPSAELASAGLVQRLEGVVNDASPGNRSCVIINRSPMQPDTHDRFVRVAVQVRLRCGTPELALVLYSLESGSPRLFVNNLNVMAQRYPLSPNESGHGLDVAFELAGFLRPGSEQKPASLPQGSSNAD